MKLRVLLTSLKNFLRFALGVLLSSLRGFTSAASGLLLSPLSGAPASKDASAFSLLTISASSDAFWGYLG